MMIFNSIDHGLKPLLPHLPTLHTPHQFTDHVQCLITTNPLNVLSNVLITYHLYHLPSELFPHYVNIAHQVEHIRSQVGSL